MHHLRVVSTALLVAALSPLAVAQRFSVTEIPFPADAIDPNGSGLSVQSINALGQVTLEAFVSDPNSTDPCGCTQYPYIYTHGKFKKLNVPNGTAQAINFFGQATGEAVTSTESAVAYIYSGNTVKNLESPPGTTVAYAYGINDFGEVAGYLYPSQSSIPMAFLYSNGKMKVLGTLPGDSVSLATGINDLGQVTGNSFHDLTQHAFLYEHGKMKDLGLPAGAIGAGAVAINNLGRVTGSLLGPEGEDYAVIFEDGKIKELGNLPFQNGNAYYDPLPAAINDFDEVVGHVSVTNQNYAELGHAFIYTDQLMQDLNSLIPSSLNLELQYGVGINVAGQIIVQGQPIDAPLFAPTHAYLLSPICDRREYPISNEDLAKNAHWCSISRTLAHRQ
jgi:probable HAF family extracellular repeat protein